MSKETPPTAEQLKIATAVNKLLFELLTGEGSNKLFAYLERERKHVVIFCSKDRGEYDVIAIDRYRRVILEHLRKDGEGRTGIYTIQPVLQAEVSPEYQQFIIGGKMLMHQGGEYSYNPLAFGQDFHPFVALILDYWGRYKGGELTAEMIKENIAEKYIVAETYFPTELPPYYR